MRLLQWRWALLDIFAWLVAGTLAATIRFELIPSGTVVTNYLLVGIAAALTQLAVGYIFNLYQGRYRTASFDDFRNISVTTITVAVIVTIPIVAFHPVDFPRSMAFTSGVIALTIMIAARALHRVNYERSMTTLATAENVILFGAGEAGEQLARSMRRDPNAGFNPVAFLDDDPKYQNLRLEGVPVEGTRHDLSRLVRQTGATTLIAAVANADSTLLTDLSERADRAGVNLLVLPPVSQLVTQGVGIGDLREISEADLLGRAVVETDQQAISELIHGKRVLITGAGGSIGSELARKIQPFGPKRLFLLDRDESALHAVQMSLHGHALLEGEDVILADIRDPHRLTEVFDECQPEIVFHAAALKHLPLLQHAPKEAIKTNIAGTTNVLAAAERSGVEVFVNISTDKAANPTSVLGFSKRITERLTAELDSRNGARYISVRFGNVLGSRGSMLGTFTEQINRGGPVTVTHPDITRFFMTIPEACELVLQASVVGRGGEVLILDMGDPVRITDVANRLIRHSGQRIKIVYTGLRDGEKLHEDLVSDTEDGARPFHPKITHVRVPALDPSAARPDLREPDEEIRTWMAKMAYLVPEVSAPQPIRVASPESSSEEGLPASPRDRVRDARGGATS